MYYLYNAHGDVIQLLNSSGEVTKTYNYDAYGNELTRDLNDSNPFRYCGEYYDTETGFIYLRARYYNPSVGRFISVDPIHDGINWYAYCGNNPLSNVDPWGLRPKDLSPQAAAVCLDGSGTTSNNCGTSNNKGTGSSTVNKKTDNSMKTSTSRADDSMEVKYSKIDEACDNNINHEYKKWHDNETDAAYNFALEYNEESYIRECEINATIYSRVFYLYENEYCTLMQIVAHHLSGEIVSMRDYFLNCKKVTLYYYSSITYGEKNSYQNHVKFEAGKGRLAAFIHTHGPYKPGKTSDIFSIDDELVAKDWNTKIYLSAYSGVLSVYDSANNTITTLEDYIVPIDPHYIY